MRFTACDCGAEYYRRGQRAWWMKAMWTRRLFRCYACDAEMMLPPEEVALMLERQRRRSRRGATAKPAVAWKGS